MSTMGTRAEATSHLLSRGAIAIAFVALALGLAGCSSGASESSSGGADAAIGGAVGNEGAPAAEGDGGDSVASTGDSSDDRSIIVTGSMYMTVEDPIKVADQATALVEDAGGRIDSRSERTPSEYEGGYAELVMRIPARGLDPVVQDLRALGTVDEFSTNSADVTREVQDLEAKISTLRASTARIQGLLTDAE